MSEENDCKGGAIFWLWIWWVFMLIFAFGICVGIYVVSALNTMF